MGKVFRFSWVEMHGGFNQECVIEAPTKELALQVFNKKVGLMTASIEEVVTRAIVLIHHSYNPEETYLEEKESLIEELREKVRTTPAPVATLEIHSCLQCPHLKQERCYTSDSWELAHDWHCQKELGKKIEGYVGWTEEKRVKIPNWCPILK